MLREGPKPTQLPVGRAGTRTKADWLWSQPRLYYIATLTLRDPFLLLKNVISLAPTLFPQLPALCLSLPAGHFHRVIILVPWLFPLETAPAI